jgi:hypothetical protein
MKIFDSVPKYPINFVFDESRMKSDLITKCKLFDSIEIAILETSANAEPSTNTTFRGIVIDLREEPVNAFDSMHVNSESVSNEIDESELQSEKQYEERIWT